MLKNGLIAALALVSGLALSTWLQSGHAARKAPAAEAELADPASAREDRAELRAMLREELARLGAAALAAAPAAPAAQAEDKLAERERAPVADAPRTETQLALRDEAKQIVATRLAAGVWRREDERRWWEIAGDMNPADHATLRLEILRAQNAGTLAPEPFGDRPSGGPAATP